MKAAVTVADDPRAPGPPIPLTTLIGRLVTSRWSRSICVVPELLRLTGRAQYAMGERFGEAVIPNTIGTRFEL